jgi:hypothetical protein
MSSNPNIASLGQWLNSWVTDTGAIHGFHNHSVWGDNPWRYGDNTAGHATFASPLIAGVARALKQQPDPRGREWLERMIRFQATSFQENGFFKHVGYQCGEQLHVGLIHNVVPCVALSAAAAEIDFALEEIDHAVRTVLAACDAGGDGGPGVGSCTNQEYCRIWSRLLHMNTYDHQDWHERVPRHLDYMIETFHVRGHPDNECVGTWRGTGGQEGLEPAEYYGLMIHPLLLGYQRYGKQEYFDEALAMARHCVRSSWVDAEGQRRAHRLWTEITGEWRCLREPMLIGGFGMTLSAIQALLEIQADDELSEFLTAMDATYAHYQHEAGFFRAASGWGCEQDIIPCTAWQSHDFLHLVGRHGVDENFWDAVFTPNNRVAAMFGQSLIWLEAGPHWAVRGFHWADGLELVGRKDRVEFGRDKPGSLSPTRVMPEDYQIPDEPQFLRDGDQFYQWAGRTDVDTFPELQ